MSAILNLSGGPVEIHFDPSKFRMNDEEFYRFCQLNPDLRIERTSDGDVIVMAPTGGKTGIQNAKLTARLTSWAEHDGSGVAFDSSTEFMLPNRAGRSPDASWIRNERWDALSQREQERFPPLCPDFAVELRSQTDSLNTLQEKMQEYLENGAELGWLIDPLERKVHVYRRGTAIQVLDDPQIISGEPLLKGFTLNVQELWD
jgi:Uma2 family endonuclease